MNGWRPVPAGAEPAGRPTALPGFAGGIEWTSTMALLAVAAAVLVALGVAAALLLRPRLPSAPSRPGTPPAPRPGPDPDASLLGTQRSSVIAGCLTVRELLDDPLLADVLDNALRGGGVSVFDPTGHRTDPTRHRIDHTVAAPDAAHDGLIAKTLTPGYLDGGRLLKPAAVVVYKWKPT